MTYMILPTRGRLDMLTRFLASYQKTTAEFTKGVKPRLVVVVDDDPATHSWIQTEDSPLLEGVFFINCEIRRGYWTAVNIGLTGEALDEPFVYIGKDVSFAPDWYDVALREFWQKFPDGLGLLSFNDGIHNGNNASHGMTTRRWLRVVFGEAFFPHVYWHHHCDSEFTNRSRDLGRYTYCSASAVTHLHEPSGHDSIPPGINDYDVQNERYIQWKNGGLKEAQARLSAETILATR